MERILWSVNYTSVRLLEKDTLRVSGLLQQQAAKAFRKPMWASYIS